MHEALKLYWQLHFERYSNEDVLRDNFVPVRDYEDELIQGPIIDIGCGQSEVLLSFATSDRTLFAIDTEPFQLDLLRKRVLAQTGATIENWHFLETSFPDNSLPDHKYALIVLSNLLHFFSLPECLTIGTGLLPYTSPGSLIYVKVHSSEHRANKPDDPERYDYFKHYFSAHDLSQIFTHEHFEQIYLARIDRVDTKAEREFTCYWIKKWYEHLNIHNPKRIAQAQQSQLAETCHSQIVAVFRRK